MARTGRTARVLLVSFWVVLVVGAVTLTTLALTSSDDDPPQRSVGHSAARPSAPASPSSSAPVGAAAPSASDAPIDLGPLITNRFIGDRATLRVRSCRLPAWGVDDKRLRAYLDAAKSCLDDAWRPLVQRSSPRPFTSPRLEFPTRTSATTACGTITFTKSVAAFHCAGTIYLPPESLQLDRYRDRPGPVLALLAHEYAHNIQGLVGIESAYGAALSAAGARTAIRDELSRRFELQAQCMSGVFFGAAGRKVVPQKMFDDAQGDQMTRGDQTSLVNDHGDNVNYSRWWNTGATARSASSCNTWTSPAPAVA